MSRPNQNWVQRSELFVKPPNYWNLHSSQYAPEHFFPTETFDIYNEAAFPHEWNYGLPEFPLPKQLSTTDVGREGSIDFEYPGRRGEVPSAPPRPGNGATHEGMFK